MDRKLDWVQILRPRNEAASTPHGTLCRKRYRLDSILPNPRPPDALLEERRRYRQSLPTTEHQEQKQQQQQTVNENSNTGLEQ
jgi:hypothetical protein